MAEGSRRPTFGGRSLDRLINFSDAVVAVAVTLLALPLVDIPGPRTGQTVWEVLGDHSSQIWTFLFTFFVVAVMWMAHNRILNSLETYDTAIFWLNTSWLAAIVLLPWVSSMYGEGSWSGTGVGLLYWGAMAAISLLGAALGGHIRRHRELLPADAHQPSEADRRRAALRGPVLGLFFLLIGLVSLVSPEIAAWLPIGIIPLSIWLRPVTVPVAETESSKEDA